MWIKCNSKTWRHECGAIISNQSYMAHGFRFKQVFLFNRQQDYDNGTNFKLYNSVIEAKNDSNQTN